MDERKEHLAELSDLEGAPCFNCPEGTYEPDTTTRTLEKGSTVLVVKDVPALVCDKCGDPAFSESVSARLEALLEDAVVHDVELQVRRFRSSESGSLDQEDISVETV